MASNLGDVAVLSRRLQDHAIEPVLEIMVALDERGLMEGRLPREILRQNLNLIDTLGIRLVHWHLYTLSDPVLRQIEVSITEECARAQEIATSHGFQMGIENNPPEGWVHVNPEQCASDLAAVGELGLVWDLNHTAAKDIPGFHALSDRVQMLHVSDTPLPETNHHLPLGMGRVPIESVIGELVSAGFSGPMILEIGGHEVSGGHGR